MNDGGCGCCPTAILRVLAPCVEGSGLPWGLNFCSLFGSWLVMYQGVQVGIAVATNDDEWLLNDRRG